MEPIILKFSEKVMAGMTAEKARYIHEASQKSLLSTLKTAELLDDKSLKLLSYLVVIISAIIGYCFSHGDSAPDSARVLLALCAPLFLAAAILTFYVLPVTIYTEGNHPRNLIDESVICGDGSLICLTELQSIQNRIDYNLKVTKKKSTGMAAAFYMVFLTLLLAAFCAQYFITYP